MAHTKAGGTTKNSRDSAGRRLGIKATDGQLIHAGTIGKDSEGCILPGAVITKNKNGKITAIGRSIDTFYKIINKIKEKKGLENIKIKITNEIEDEYNIKQQIEKKDGDKERAKEEKRKKK